VSPGEARALVALLLAAFPSPAVPEATANLYRSYIVDWNDLEAAGETIHAVVLNEERWPPFALLLREYRIRAKRNADQVARVRGLAEAPLDLAENARQARALLERLTTAVDERPAAGWLSDWNGNGEGGEE
jgi:hypothetical protein